MHQPPIWQSSCLVLDIVLLGAFDWRELANELTGASYRDGSSEQANIPENPALVIQTANRACRTSNKFSKSMQKQLDYRYYFEIQAVQSTEDSKLVSTFSQIPLRDSEQVAAITWALARDSREASQEALSVLLSRIQKAAVWSFMRSLRQADPSEVQGIEE